MSRIAVSGVSFRYIICIVVTFRSEQIGRTCNIKWKPKSKSVGRPRADGRGGHDSGTYGRKFNPVVNMSGSASARSDLPHADWIFGVGSGFSRCYILPWLCKSFSVHPIRQHELAEWEAVQIYYHLISSFAHVCVFLQERQPSSDDVRSSR